MLLRRVLALRERAGNGFRGKLVAKSGLIRKLGRGRFRFREYRG